MVSPRVARILIEAMVKHLPPSASRLSLLDVEGKASEILAKHRSDLDITVVSADLSGVADAMFDAVTAFDDDLRPELLNSALAALRPGGRLILMATTGDPHAEQVQVLEAHGFTRILVETGAECPLPVGVLLRGERPHETMDTHERVRVAADQDSDAITLEAYRGRFLHLLVRQIPNKPAWAIRADEVVTWDAVTLDGTLLAFTSLPKAVAFMQPVVVNGQIKDVSKVAKFRKETVAAWPHGIALNPTPESLNGGLIGMVSVDPGAAETPDE